MPEGQVKWFNATQGFGYITTPEGADIYVHHSAIKESGRKSLKDGERVTFEVQEGPRGAKAINVKVARK